VYPHDAAGSQTKAVKVCEQKRHCTMGRNAPGIGTCLSGIPVFSSLPGERTPFWKAPALFDHRRQGSAFASTQGNLSLSLPPRRPGGSPEEKRLC